jgi:hypothetical protein
MRTHALCVRVLRLLVRAGACMQAGAQVTTEDVRARGRPRGAGGGGGEVVEDCEQGRVTIAVE